MRNLNEEEIKPRYCISLAMRDEQIRHAIRVVKDRVEGQQRRQEGDDKAAIVGYGPSLQKTWELIREFKYVFSCSGAHKYLIERGIIPTWHVEVDPRRHKVSLLGDSHPDVEYLPASTCHPDYLRHLAGRKVKLWHVFDAMEDGLRLLPPEEWAITGGCDVGLRAMTMAAFFGFRDLHIFGMDGCVGEKRHADVHPNENQELAEFEYRGKKFITTPSLLTAARQVWHELDAMPAVRAKFHGEGLIQEMAKDYKFGANVIKNANDIAFQKIDTISKEYVKLNEKLHQEKPSYGMSGKDYALTVYNLAEKLGTTCVLDYGCGKGTLGRALPFPIWEYDPAIEGKRESPRPAALVVCTDVLEHVEPERLLFVLADLQRCILDVGFFVISTGESMKFLDDGRNTHLIQQDAAWWKERLEMFFEVGEIVEKKLAQQIQVIVGVKKAVEQQEEEKQVMA